MLQRSKFVYLSAIFVFNFSNLTVILSLVLEGDSNEKTMVLYHPFILVTNEQSCGESALSSRYPSFQLLKNGLDPTITSAHVHTSFYPVPTR